MRGRILGVLALAVVSTVITAGPARAQEAQVTLVADIPFAFMVENTLLPAGKYEFSQLAGQVSEWSVADAKGLVRVFFSTEPAEIMSPPRAYEVTFDVIGGKSFLTNIWLNGDKDGYFVAMTRSEKALMKQGMTPKKERVSIKKKEM